MTSSCFEAYVRLPWINSHNIKNIRSHDLHIIFALPAIYDGNPPVTIEFPVQRIRYAQHGSCWKHRRTPVFWVSMTFMRSHYDNISKKISHSFLIKHMNMLFDFTASIKTASMGNIFSNTWKTEHGFEKSKILKEFVSCPLYFECGCFYHNTNIYKT